MTRETDPSPTPSRKPPRNYFARSEQLRLMMLVGSLGLVLVLMMRAADPETWRWIAPDEIPDAQPAAGNQNEAPVPDEEIRVPRKAVAGDNGTDGEFRLVADRRPATPYTLGEKGNGSDEKKTSELWASPQALADVEDSSPFRASDFDAWSQIYDRLGGANAQQLSSENAPLVQFSQLFQQSKLYRGKLVTIEGTIRRCVKLPPNKLDERAGNLWQMWVFSGAENNPIVVYCIHLPDGFPVGNQINEKASFQAVYFKKWVYAAQGGTMTAPLLLARNVNWQASPETRREITAREIYLGIAVVLLGAIAIVGFIWWNNRNRDSRAEQIVRHRNRKQFEENADEINVGQSVRDQLGALSAQMKNSSPSANHDDSSSA